MPRLQSCDSAPHLQFVARAVSAHDLGDAAHRNHQSKVKRQSLHMGCDGDLELRVDHMERLAAPDISQRGRL
jgi:hypothetical protein